MLRCLSLVFIFICSAYSFAETADSSTVGPRSVILLIGDGFDDQHVTMGRNYLVGPDGTLLLDSLPIRGAVQVQTVAPEGGVVLCRGLGEYRDITRHRRDYKYWPSWYRPRGPRPRNYSGNGRLGGVPNRSCQHLLGH